MSFTTKKIEEEPQLGHKLKEAREAAGIDLEKMAKELRVRKTHLQKLEEGDYRKLPADVYVKGFLKKYAQFLKINEGTIFEQYDLEEKRRQGFSAVLASYSPLITTEQHRQNRAIVTIKTSLLTLTLLAVSIVGGYFLYQLDFLFGSPKLDLVFPKVDLITNEEKITVIGRAEPNSVLMLNGQQIYINHNGDFKEEITLSQGLNIIELKVKNRFEKATTVVRKIVRQ